MSNLIIVVGSLKYGIMIIKFVEKYIINFVFFLMLYIIIKAITIFLYLKEHSTYYIKEIHNYVIILTNL